MNFIEKKTQHDNLLGVTHIDADKQLLARVMPNHKLLQRGTFNATVDASDILWALLEYATSDEIVANRRSLAVVIASPSDEEEAAEETAALAKAAEETKAAEEAAALAKAAEETKATEKDVASKKKSSKKLSTPK